jgi:hypothetical protein
MANRKEKANRGFTQMKADLHGLSTFFFPIRDHLRSSAARTCFLPFAICHLPF